MTRRHVVARLLILVLSGLACTQPTFAQRTYTTAQVGDRALRLELSVPKEEGPHPLIVWVHGGGWVGGDHERMPPFTPYALDAGFAVASLDYRLTSEGGAWGDAPVCWPAQLHDCKAGVRWLRANAARLRLDPDRIYAWGHSAGGHLVTMLALTNDEPAFEGTVGDDLDTSSSVRAVVDFAGPTDLFRMNEDHDRRLGPGLDHDDVRSPESRLLGADQHGHSLETIRANRDSTDWPWKRLRLLCLSASPIEQVDEEDDAPLLIVHGAKDAIVPMPQARRLARACKASGVPHELVVFDEAGHGLFASPATKRALAWLKSLAFAKTAERKADDDRRKRGRNAGE